MATGPEHYREAERLLDQSKTWANADTGWKGQLSAEERLAYRRADLAEAQVHADLAKAAATAMGAASDEGMSLPDFKAWNEAAGV